MASKYEAGHGKYSGDLNEYFDIAINQRIPSKLKSSVAEIIKEELPSIKGTSPQSYKILQKHYQKPINVVGKNIGEDERQALVQAYNLLYQYVTREEKRKKKA